MSTTTPRAARAAAAIALLVSATCLGAFAVQRPAPDEPAPSVWDQAAARASAVEAEILRLRDVLVAHETRLARLERALGGPGPEPTAPPDPGPDPTPTPTRPPRTPQLGAQWDFTLRSGQRVTGRAIAVDGLLRAQAGPLRLEVAWDDFDGPGPMMAPTPTLILSNGQEGRGTVYWQRGSVTVTSGPGTDWPIDLGERGCMPPRKAVAQTALTLEHWALIPETAPIPAVFRAKALAEIQAAKARWLGPYRLFVKEGDAQAPGGRAIGAYHGGVRDWLAECAEGKAYRMVEMLDSASRGLWLQEPDGSEWLPGTHGIWYWWQASAVEYAPPGWRWAPKADGWCAYELALADEPITALDHGSRFYAAAFALAPHSRAARIVARACVLESLRAYTMDRRVPGTSPATTDDDGFTPLWQILELPGRGHMDRRHAHAIRVVAEAAACGLLTPAERALYLPAWVAAARKADDGRGVLDHGFSGDASHSGLPAPAAMFFQQALLCDALRFLGEQPEAAGAREIGDRIAKWWGARPPYFAHTGGSYRSATAAPNKGAPGHDYALWTVPGTWYGSDGANYGSFAGVVEASEARSLGESLVGYVPQAWREW